MAGTADRDADSTCPDEHGPSWRQLNRRLWVGHNGTAVLGTIEQGSRYVYIDQNCAARRGFHTLEEAQSAAAAAIELQVLPTVMAPRQTLRTMVVHGAVLLTGAATVGTAAWAIGSALFVL